MRGSFGGIVLGIVITLVIGGACAAASNALGMATKSEDVMAPVINIVMMPVLLLSGILLPMTLGPGWLTRISDFMPTRWITDAIRDVFAGDIANGTVLAGVAGLPRLPRPGRLVGHRDVPEGRRVRTPPGPAAPPHVTRGRLWISRRRGSTAGRESLRGVPTP